MELTLATSHNPQTLEREDLEVCHKESAELLFLLTTVCLKEDWVDFLSSLGLTGDEFVIIELENEDINLHNNHGLRIKLVSPQSGFETETQLDMNC